MIAGFFLVAATACGAPYVPPPLITGVATDKGYGYSQQSPIKVGGAAEGQKANHREAFVKSLRGPMGQPVSYVNQGTCCSFELSPGSSEKGEIEVLLISYPGIPNPLMVYLDYYHFESPKAPVGFTFGIVSPD